MTFDLAIVLGLLAATIVMFAVNRPRTDVVALLMMTLLPLSGVITLDQALAGFSDPNIILIAALFVVGEALVRTGVAQKMGDMLVRQSGASETRLIALLMISAAGIGAFMSSTGVVAIFIPIVLRVAANLGTSPGRLMMPLSVAALISGMMTLVATAPNLVLDSLLRREGHAGFAFFDFSPFGLPVLVLAIAYMLIARRWLGSTKPPSPATRPRLADWVEAYGLAGNEFRLRVGKTSPLINRRLDQLDLRSSAGINLLGIERWAIHGRRLIHPRGDSELQADDILLLDIPETPADIDSICDAYDLVRMPISGHYFSDQAQDIGMVELLVPPESQIARKTPVQSEIRNRFGLTLVGLRRDNRPVTGPIYQQTVRAGDVLLAVGQWKAIRALMRSRDLIVLNLPAENDEVIEVPGRVTAALAILGLIVILMVWGIVPNVIAALIGCLLLGLFGCVDMPAAYRSIHWQSLILIIGMLPFSIALQQTGGVALAAEGLGALIGEANPRAALAAVFVVTAMLGLFISNTATAVLMGPVALQLAAKMGVSPYPFVMTVALAASAAFLTPVSSPVNTLVVGPGNYRFFDFTRIGMPLVLIVLGVAVLLVPLLFPFSGA